MDAVRLQTSMGQSLGRRAMCRDLRAALQIVAFEITFIQNRLDD